MAVRVSVVDSILGAAPLPRSPELRICENRALRGESGTFPNIPRRAEKVAAKILQAAKSAEPVMAAPPAEEPLEEAA